MSRARQQKQADEMRRKILDTAQTIVQTEGAEALSIRRITKELDYSPGSLYHYFGSKDEILHQLLLRGYRKILAAVRPPLEGLAPAEAVRAAIRSYIDSVLCWPEEYRAVMLSSQPQILAVTSVLGAEARETRPAMDALAAAIEKGVDAGVFLPCDPLATAQAVWCAVFGLAIRLIIEGACAQPGRDELVERQIGILVKGLMA